MCETCGHPRILTANIEVSPERGVNLVQSQDLTPGTAVALLVEMVADAAKTFPASPAEVAEGRRIADLYRSGRST